ncbi:MAG: hypothetical protein IJB21_01395 [Bacilli bacterium]|nr:hypothetical protein [Bacilli bacterium]
MNKIIKIANYDLDKYKKQFKEAYIVELDGEKIRSWKDYIKFATKLFKIENLEYGYNQHIDNMEDRDYFLNVNSILLIVHNYNKFMKFRKKDKLLFEEVYREDILPWYDSEIIKCRVGGKRIDFNVLLIEE